MSSKNKVNIDKAIGDKNPNTGMHSIHLCYNKQYNIFKITNCQDEETILSLEDMKKLYKTQMSALFAMENLNKKEDKDKINRLKNAIYTIKKLLKCKMTNQEFNSFHKQCINEFEERILNMFLYD